MEPMNPIQEASGPKRGILVLIATVAVIALAAVAWSFLSDDGSSTAASLIAAEADGQDAVPAPDAPASSQAAEPSDSASGVDSSAVPGSDDPPPSTDGSAGAVAADLVGHENPQIEALMRETERLRGLRFLRPVETQLLDEDAFRAQLLEEFQRDIESGELDDVELVWQALALIDHDTDLEAVLLSALGEGVLGYYDPETDRLVMRGAELTPFVSATLVHELTHALDDQHFELDRPEIEEIHGDEGTFGFTGLVEGSASWVEDRWKEGLSAAESAELDREAAAFSASMDIGAIPEIVLIDLSLPYEFGPLLVDAIVRDGGLAGLDAAMVDPPVSGEQVLDPTAYLEGDEPRDVSPPPADGPVEVDGVIGASGWLELTFQVDPTAAVAFMTTWGGDAFVAWRDGDRSCLRVDVVADPDGSIDELAAGLQSIAANHPDATVSRPDEETARLTACA